MPLPKEWGDGTNSVPADTGPQEGMPRGIPPGPRPHGETRFVVGNWFETSKWMPGLKRKDLQTRARSSLESAVLLLRNCRWSDAYHISGYALELGPKACTARQISTETIPEKEFGDSHP